MSAPVLGDAAATETLHTNELVSINMIYCHVMQLEDVRSYLVESRN